MEIQEKTFWYFSISYEKLIKMKSSSNKNIFTYIFKPLNIVFANIINIIALLIKIVRKVVTWNPFKNLTLWYFEFQFEQQEISFNKNFKCFSFYPDKYR